MDRIALINKVKTLIDEISSSDSLIIDVGVEDNNPIDQIVESLLDESALELLMKAPFYRLDITSFDADPVADEYDTATGYISLPDDFLRLVYFRMSDWLRPVTELAIKGDALSLRQYNKHIRGGVARPVGVLSKNGEGMIVEYYSTNAKQHQVADFQYIRRVCAEQIPSQLTDSLCWICAGKTLTVMGRADIAKTAYDNAQSLML